MQAGLHVCVLDNLSNSEQIVLERIARITGKRPSFIEADVCNTSAVADALRQYEVQAVIHFAGLKAVGESATQPIDYYANNVQGTISLLQAMQSSVVKTLVFSSSATVYGNPQYLPIDESHPTSATNPYGRTKLHIEEILADVSRSDPSWRIACHVTQEKQSTHPLHNKDQIGSSSAHTSVSPSKPKNANALSAVCDCQQLNPCTTSNHAATKKRELLCAEQRGKAPAQRREGALLARVHAKT
jgi:hypothetical protein